MTEEEYTILEDLYMDRWPGAKRTNSLMRKCEALYELAKEARGGAVVELGAYHGCGIISLAFGARAGDGLQVFTVDDHVRRQGWAGEWYYLQDKARFLDCVKVAGVDVTLVSRSVDGALKLFKRGGIVLLVWDLGVKDRLQKDFDSWDPLVSRGGVFAVREGDRKGKPQLGSDVVMRRAVKSGEWELGKQFPKGHLYTLRKK